MSQMKTKLYWQNVLEKLAWTTPFYHNITKNTLPLFCSKNIVVTSNSKQRIAILEADLRLYANLFVACQARDSDLDNFFAHKNHVYLVSLSEYGKLRKFSAKSDFLQCLNDINIKLKLNDININKPKTLETFGPYCSEEIPWKLHNSLAI